MRWGAGHVLTRVLKTSTCADGVDDDEGPAVVAAAGICTLLMRERGWDLRAPEGLDGRVGDTAPLQDDDLGRGDGCIAGAAPLDDSLPLDDILLGGNAAGGVPGGVPPEDERRGLAGEQLLDTDLEPTGLNVLIAPGFTQQGASLRLG